MHYNRLGHSGLKVPALTFGTGTFGGKGDFFAAWGSTDAKGAEKVIDICLDHGVTMFDSADVYSDGACHRCILTALRCSRRDGRSTGTRET